ncbi:MAG: VWA domain-containing protein [Capnocytophaga sp.]|nr:VWA domain-containing protein [Capnocytophaga sp.]
MIHIDEKFYFYLLILLPILGVFFVLILLWRKKTQRIFANKESLSKLAPERSYFKYWVKFCFFAIILFFIIIGLTNPKIGTKIETVKREGIDIVFAIDVSKSMLAEDVKPSRMEKAKHIVSEIINNLKGDRIAFVPYAGQAYAMLPLTSDYSAAKMFLQGLNTDMLSSQGTAVGDALQVSLEYFKSSTQASKLLIVISDGEDHEAGVSEVIDEIKDKGIRVYTIGLGTTQGSTIPIKENGRTTFKTDREGEVVITKLNKELLEEMAKEGNGKYFDGSNTREVTNNIQKALNNIEKNEYESQIFSDYKDQFQWFLGIALFFLVLDVFISYKKTAWVKKLNLFNEK